MLAYYIVFVSLPEKSLRVFGQETKPFNHLVVEIWLMATMFKTFYYKLGPKSMKY